MKKEKYFWIFSTLIYIALIIYLSVSKPIVNYSDFKGEDKIIHFIAYFIGADLTFMAVSELKKFYLKILTTLSYLSLPIITEYLQSFSKYHVFDIKDMYAGFLGMCIGFFYFLSKKIAFKDVVK
ncbi:hypothetical protein OSSY52_03050 [Tepiditoga spiralis]|uniref:VanZ-like domain-containing protein n=1 Tax=Tepiditoga spiralis TaxID=2108365 RepID=A0A7G1G571_9BACT|nr:hypothetical protein [Tepiditoga spiralis]BBE30164.1 hypothetical protein OSSY52_03050 [Tepiditoga spiralis]